VRLLTPREAGAALLRVEEARRRARSQRGVGWCYAADELYILADQAIPPAEYYDDWPLVENGVGALRRFLDDFDRGLGAVPRLRGRRLRIVTGTTMAPFIRELAPRLSRQTSAVVEAVPVVNDFFGSTVTVAGLLPGESILRSLVGVEVGDIVLLPATALNTDAFFIDDLPLAALRDQLAPATVAAGSELTEAIRSL